MRHARNTLGGFTLVEVLVAMALAGACLVPMLVARANAARQMAAARRLSAAVTLVEAELARLRVEVAATGAAEETDVECPAGLALETEVYRRDGTETVAIYEVTVTMVDTERPGRPSIYTLTERVAHPLTKAEGAP